MQKHDRLFNQNEAIARSDQYDRAQRNSKRNSFDWAIWLDGWRSTAHSGPATVCPIPSIHSNPVHYKRYLALPNKAQPTWAIQPGESSHPARRIHSSVVPSDSIQSSSVQCSRIRSLPPSATPIMAIHSNAIRSNPALHSTDSFPTHPSPTQLSAIQPIQSGP